MKRIIFILLICCWQNAYSQRDGFSYNFSSSYEIKNYYSKNIQYLDPIEGVYDVDFAANTNSPWAPNLRDNDTFYIVKEYENSFAVYSEGGGFHKGENLSFKKIGDTNVYRASWQNSSVQAYLENRTRLSFSIELYREDARKFAQNPNFAWRIILVYNMIKEYPRPSMY